MNPKQKTALEEIKALHSAIEILEPHGWGWTPRHPNSWIFSKGGKLFDLSAADISKHEQIFEKGSFQII